MTKHVDAGKWRCAKCDHRWKPKSVPRRSLPPCPSCKELDDVFPADDGGWERAAAYRSRQNNDPMADFRDDDL
jgi:NAD-dependent SIR2 family protein deacetylase